MAPLSRVDLFGSLKNSCPMEVNPMAAPMEAAGRRPIKACRAF